MHKSGASVLCSIQCVKNVVTCQSVTIFVNLEIPQHQIYHWFNAMIMHSVIITPWAFAQN